MFNSHFLSGCGNPPASWQTMSHLRRPVSRWHHVSGAYTYKHKASATRVHRQLHGDGSIYLEEAGNKRVFLVTEAAGLQFMSDNPIAISIYCVALDRRNAAEMVR